jgi:hypothetical protein
MKPVLFTICLVLASAVQTSVAAVPTSPAIPMAGPSTAVSCPVLADLQGPQQAQAGFTATPVITPPAPRAHGAAAEPALLASNCLTYVICAGGNCQSYRVCW